MKKGLLVILSLLFSFAGYANQCSEYWHKGNYEQAFTSCKEEAEQDNAEAQYYLAVMYDKGDGIEQNRSLAQKYYQQACDEDFQEACNNLEQLTE